MRARPMTIVGVFQPASNAPAAWSPNGSRRSRCPVSSGCVACMMLKPQLDLAHVDTTSDMTECRWCQCLFTTDWNDRRLRTTAPKPCTTDPSPKFPHILFDVSRVSPGTRLYAHAHFSFLSYCWQVQALSRMTLDRLRSLVHLSRFASMNT